MEHTLEYCEVNGDFREKTLQSGFPTQSQNTRSGVRTIWDLVAPVPTLTGIAIYRNLLTKFFILQLLKRTILPLK